MASIRKNIRSGRFEVRYRSPDGVQRTKGGFDRKADAQAFRSQIEQQLNRGDWQDPLLARITVAQWADEFLATRAGVVRPTTYNRDDYALRRYIVPALGALPLGRVRPADVKRMFTPLTTRLAPRTVRGIHSVAKLLFNVALDEELIRVNPVRGVKLPTIEPTDMRLLSLAEIATLADVMPVEYRAFPFVGGVLGLRFSELAGLRVRDVDFFRRAVAVEQTVSEVAGHVQVAPVKSHSSRRTISSPSFVIEAVSQQLAYRDDIEPDSLVFTSPRGLPLRYSLFHRRTWSPAVRQAGLEGLRIHGLRHTAAGLMIEQGHHPRTIMGRMGHSSITVTMNVYGRLMPAADDAVARSMESEFRSLGGADVVRRVVGEQPWDTP